MFRSIVLIVVVTACAEPITVEEQRLRVFELQDEVTARAQYETLDRDVREMLWTAHLDRALASGTLDPAQTELVIQVRDNLEAALGADGDALEARAQAIMTEEQMNATFGRLGELRRAEVAPDIHSLLLQCNTRWNCSNECVCIDQNVPQMPVSGGVPCYQDSCGGNCNATNAGCGMLWLQSCTSSQTSVQVNDCPLS